MAGWEVEREARTACRSRPISHGGSSLMPSQSQGAERRPERRAGHIGSRWALRALVISGLAGVAWLLTGTAANAADHDDEPGGSLSVSTMESVSVYGDEPLVGELLKAAVQPLESESAPSAHQQVPPINQQVKAHRHHELVTSIVTAVERTLSEPVGMLDEAVRDGSAIDAELIGAEWRSKAVPPRTSGADTDDRTGPEPVEDAADLVTGPVPADLPPVASAPVISVSPAADPVVAERPVAAGQTRAAAGKALPASVSHSTRASRASAGVTPVRHAKLKSRSHVSGKLSSGRSGHRHVPAVEPAEPETAREEAPGDDRPAPMRMNLGQVSGVPAGGPGASPEFGSVAVLPARIANGVVDDHQFPLASDIDARRHDAEAPMVSPD